MESASTLPADGPHAGGTETHFALELLGLIARIIATALAINIVFAGIVLLVAGQAEAAGTAPLSSRSTVTANAIQPGRADPSTDSVAAKMSARDLRLATVHRLTTRPTLQLNAISEES